MGKGEDVTLRGTGTMMIDEKHQRDGAIIIFRGVGDATTEYLRRYLVDLVARSGDADVFTVESSEASSLKTELNKMVTNLVAEPLVEFPVRRQRKSKWRKLGERGRR